MPKIINPKNIELNANEASLKEYKWTHTGNLGKDLNLEDFSCSIRALEQSSYSYPYHYHHNSEELFVIISGNGELRTPEGIREVQTGEIILFEKGKNSAHQLYNPHKETLMYLDLRSLNKLDVCEYPDSNKINILSNEIFEKGKNMNYFDGENNVNEIWKKIKK